jgi:hypothetical protein
VSYRNGNLGIGREKVGRSADAPSDVVVATRLLREGDDKLAKPSPELVTKVNIAIHELMSKPEILKLLEDRLKLELKGKVSRYDGLRITNTLIRVAGEMGRPDPSKPPKEGDKHVHLHGFFDGWTRDQKREYAMTGKMPELPEAADKG